MRLTLNKVYLMIFSCMVIFLTFGFVYTCYNFNLSTFKFHPTKLQKGKCGIIVFLHINKCGGSSINKWFYEHATKNFQLKLPVSQKFRKPVKSYRELIAQQRKVTEWKKWAEKATEYTHNIIPQMGWSTFHIHNGFPGMYYIQDIIHNWKYNVERKGCVFHQTLVLRDPLDRFMPSIDYYGIPSRNIESYMESRKNWLSRYILFGICGYHKNEIRCGYDMHGNFTPTPNLNKTYIEELTKIISTFDSIGFTDRLGDHMETIRKLTGWKDNVKRGTLRSNNNSERHFNLTSNLLKMFLEKNIVDYTLYYTLRNNKKSNFLYHGNEYS